MTARAIGAFVAAALALTACASDRVQHARGGGEPVGVNAVKSAPVTGAVTGGIEPAPSALATTTATGQTTR